MNIFLKNCSCSEWKYKYNHSNIIQFVIYYVAVDVDQTFWVVNSATSIFGSFRVMLVHIFDDIVNTHASYRQQFKYKTTMNDFPGTDSTSKEKNLSFYIVLLD